MPTSVKMSVVVEKLEAKPWMRLFTRCGLAYRGAVEKEVSRRQKDYPKEVQRYDGSRMYTVLMNSWRDELAAFYKWAAAVEIASETEDELHLVGYSSNDLY